MKFLATIFLLQILSSAVQAQSNRYTVDDGRYLDFHLGVGFHSSNLSGNGFNSTLPAKEGAHFGFDFSNLNSSGEIQYNLKYDRASADQSAPSGITPAKVSIVREEIKAMVSIAPWDSGIFESLKVGVGFAVLSSGGTLTSPNNILTQQSSQGAFFNLLYKTKIDVDWNLISEVAIYLPYEVKESQQVTGYNPTFLGIELKANAEYPISDSMIGYAGIIYRFDQASYDGSVSRGVTGGKDLRTFFSFPVGIKFSY